MCDAERCNRAASHAAAHYVRFVYSECVQQAGTLAHEIIPGDLFYPPAGQAVFTEIEQNTGISFTQVIEQADAFVERVRRFLA